MIRVFRLAVLFILATIQSVKAAEDLCPTVQVVGESEISLDDAEKKLVCGDPETDEWRNIPPNQARILLEAFLQKQGYLLARFRIEKGALHVDPGPKVRVQTVEFEGTPPDFEAHRLRGLRGRSLTPTLLTSIEDWTKMRLHNIGYGCPKVESVAGAREGKIILRITHGPRHPLTTIQVDPKAVPGVDTRTLERYHAFELGELFNAQLLELTSRRMIEDGIVQSSKFVYQCADQGVTASQRLFAGEPRLFRIGIGASTEEGPIARVSWKNTRLGRTASQLEALARASFRRQQTTLSAEWYPWIKMPRFYFEPELNAENRIERSYTQLTTEIHGRAGIRWDSSNARLSLESGPELSRSLVFRGVGPAADTFLSLNGVIQYETHDFEFNRPDPIAGFRGTLDLRIREKGIYSQVSARRLRLRGESLWNVRNYDPALLVLGWRWGASTTLVTNPADAARLLPPDFRFFLGGANDLRGFGREELPAGDVGALTDAFTGFEIRWADSGIDVFGLAELEPLIFADVGAVGREPLRLDRPVYWSPGFGLRIPTPIGVFRTTASRGYVAAGGVDEAALSHLQLYLSYGEEF